MSFAYGENNTSQKCTYIAHRPTKINVKIETQNPVDQDNTVDYKCNKITCTIQSLHPNRNSQQIVSWYKKTADAKDAYAARTLAGIFQFGLFGQNIDLQQSFKYYKKAAKSGDSKIMTIIAGLYFMGTGVEQNNKKAVYWYTKGAYLGDSIAASVLGNIYENGLLGQKIDLIKSFKYYKRSTDLSNSDSPSI